MKRECLWSMFENENSEGEAAEWIILAQQDRGFRCRCRNWWREDLSCPTHFLARHTSRKHGGQLLPTTTHQLLTRWQRPGASRSHLVHACHSGIHHPPRQLSYYYLHFASDKSSGVIRRLHEDHRCLWARGNYCSGWMPCSASFWTLCFIWMTNRLLIVGMVCTHHAHVHQQWRTIDLPSEPSEALVKKRNSGRFFCWHGSNNIYNMEDNDNIDLCLSLNMVNTRHFQSPAQGGNYQGPRLYVAFSFRDK